MSESSNNNSNTLLSFGRRLVTRIVVGVLLVTIVISFNARDVINWIARQILYMFMFAIELHIVIFILLVKFIFLFTNDVTEPPPTNSLYNTHKILRASVIHELFWSKRNVTLLRNSRKDHSITLLESSVPFDDGDGLTFFENRSIGISRSLLSTTKKSLRLENKTPIQLQDESQIEYVEGLNTMLPIQNEIPPPSRTRSYFSRNFFSTRRRENDSLYSREDGEIEIISMSRDN